jgi:hypothetical protein
MMSDTLDLRGRFELAPCDGIHGAQAWVCNADDLQYWQEQAHKYGYRIVFDYHAPANAMGYESPEHDVYQILPLAGPAETKAIT